jgi:hypothetical protein
VVMTRSLFGLSHALGWRLHADAAIRRDCFP